MKSTNSRTELYRTASMLAVLTIVYNIAEGIVSAWFGAEDGTLSLFGFGVDSFVEVVSGIGIWHMIRRQQASGGEARDAFERQALRITGGGFYLLTAGLVVSAVVDLIGEHVPTSTWWGIVVSCVSLASMWLLLRYKLRVGRALDSRAILADAACSKVCLYLSAILLAASAGFQLTGIGWIDAAGALGIAWFAFKEGREALQGAKGIACGCRCGCAKK